MFRCLRTVMTLLLLLPASVTQAAPSGKSDAPQVFIETTIDNTKPWVGQELTLTYTLYFREAAPGIEDHAKPDHPGLWVHETEAEKYISSTPVEVKGILFRKAIIRRLRLMPMQSGRLSVTNYRLKCLIPNNGANTFDSRNDSETIVTAPPATLDAKPLPKPAPAGFNGAVGDFTLQAAPTANRIHVGEPLSLIITLSGNGNMEAQPALTVTLPDGLHRNEANVPSVTASAHDPSSSSLTTKITLMAEHTGSFRFRPVSLTFFNPQSAQYATIESNEVSISVIPGATPEVRQQPEELAPSSPSSGTTATPWPLLMALLSGSTLLFIFTMHARTIKKRSNTTHPASPRPAQPPAPLTPPKPSVQAPSTPKTPAPLKSPESLRRDIYEAIQKAGIANPSGMTTKEIGAKLVTLSIDAQAVTEACILLAAIDHALYTPGDTAREHLDAMNRKTAQLIATLRSGA